MVFNGAWKKEEKQVGVGPLGPHSPRLCMCLWPGMELGWRGSQESVFVRRAVKPLAGVWDSWEGAGSGHLGGCCRGSLRPNNERYPLGPCPRSGLLEEAQGDAGWT